MKSLEFLKRSLATTLALVLAWLLSVRPAQAGYTVTLQQVGPDVVATGSGAINLEGLTFDQSSSQNPEIWSSIFGELPGAGIYTGPISSSVDSYYGCDGPTSFGFLGLPASSGSGDMVGIFALLDGGGLLSVPTGYVSGTALSDSATYSGKTLATLGSIKPGTYVWTWGTTANQNFTLQIPPAPPPPPNITNISTRAHVLTGDNILDGGFIITGTEARSVLIRGIGPSLSSPDLSGVLADPTLELHGPNSSALLATNDNWLDTQEDDIQSTGIPPTNNLESAILVTLQPGAYTVILAGKDGGTGIGLVEVYDFDQVSDSMLANISTRGSVGTGADVLIGGFILGPDGGASSTVLVRAIGPSLSNANPPVLGALADPTLELHDGNGALIRSNDNWKETQQTEIEAAQLAPADDRESAIEATLAPGAYTAIVRGSGDLTGVALVEVYRIP
jgi:hypothetical protein